jgi:hypothetical protein
MLLRVLLENLTRLLLIGAIGLMGLAVLELLAQLIGQSLVGNYYSAGRLLELSAVFAVLAIALILRDIKLSLRQD